MKVRAEEKVFSKIVITLETEEELEYILRALQASYEDAESSSDEEAFLKEAHGKLERYGRFF